MSDLRLPRASAIDTGLIILFMFGIATGIDVKLGAGLPIPAVIAGAAAGLLMLRRLNLVQESDLRGLLMVVLVFATSILCATDYDFLGERFKGFLQLVYSLILGYAVYLTFQLYDRRRLARVFLIACIVIIVGCALENYTDFRAVSDAFRGAVYDFGIYISDARDNILYGRVRPKFFTSEPSAINFAFLLFAFIWYVLSTFRAKLLVFLALLMVSYFLMRGPTLLLGFPLAGLYELMLAPRIVGLHAVRINAGRIVLGLIACALLAVLFVALGSSLFATRISHIVSGNDLSFFMREIGPALVAFEVMREFPLAGVGLTGEGFIEDSIWRIYFGSPQFSATNRAQNVAHVMTNFFWYHWIYLGLFFGLAAIAAISRWLRALGTPSLIFCWSVWVVFGQASGGYVSPKTWAVLLLTAAVAALHESQPVVRRVQPRPLRAGGATTLPVPQTQSRRSPA